MCSSREACGLQSVVLTYIHVFHMRGECASPDSTSVGHKGKALMVMYVCGGMDSTFLDWLMLELTTKKALSILP